MLTYTYGVHPLYRFVLVSAIAPFSLPSIGLGFSSGSGAFGATPSTPHLEYLGESLDELLTPYRATFTHTPTHVVLTSVSVYTLTD